MTLHGSSNRKVWPAVGLVGEEPLNLAAHASSWGRCWDWTAA